MGLDSNSEAGRRFDELLVVMAQAGDRGAGERLAARWHPRLARTARRLLGEEEAALSAAQDSWLAIVRGLPGLHDPARFAPWAFAILRRRCADAIRRARRDRSQFAEGPETPETPVEPTADDRIALRQAFAALPADQRLAAHLFFAEGLTLAEIAEAQAVPLGTAKSRLFHARRQLKAALIGD
jgi:RNA polymerase sigma factor (sigma-70 family)